MGIYTTNGIMLVAPSKRKRKDDSAGPRAKLQAAAGEGEVDSRVQSPVPRDGTEFANEYGVGDDDDERREQQEAAEDDKMADLLEKRQQKNARLSELYEEFARVATEEQLARFEQYKRSKFPRSAMRRLMADIVGSSNDRCAIILASIAKMFVSELVESAVETMAAAGESGPVRPHHLRAAHHKAKRAGLVPSSSSHRRTMFWQSNSGP